MTDDKTILFVYEANHLIRQIINMTDMLLDSFHVIFMCFTKTGYQFGIIVTTGQLIKVYLSALIIYWDRTHEEDSGIY